MTLTNITRIANNYTDETFTPTVALDFFNGAISKINNRLRTTLPLIDSSEPNYANIAYTALSDDLLTDIVANFIAYSIKMNDGSLNEADRFYVRFNEELRRLEKNKRSLIDEQYWGAGFRNGYKITPYSGWF